MDSRTFILPVWVCFVRLFSLLTPTFIIEPFFKNGDVGIIECNWRQGVEIQMAHGRGIYYELDALRQKL